VPIDSEENDERWIMRYVGLYVGGIVLAVITFIVIVALRTF